MTVKELKELLKHFDDNDYILIRGYTKEDWDIITSETELSLHYMFESNYAGKRRLVIDATRL